MKTVDSIAALAKEGKTTSEIAAALGISRQRVHSAAKTNGIALPKYGRPANFRVPPPKARVQTGGIPVPISTSVAGSIAEMLVAADLMARGFHVYMPVIISRGHDIIACNGTEIITFEVRSAHRNASGKLIFGRKPDCCSDHYALVVTGEPVIYDPPLPS